MKCPWLIKTIVETEANYNSNSSKRIEHQEFDKCVKEDCPYYIPAERKGIVQHGELCGRTNVYVPHEVKEGGGKNDGT